MNKLIFFLCSFVLLSIQASYSQNTNKVFVTSLQRGAISSNFNFIRPGLDSTVTRIVNLSFYNNSKPVPVTLKFAIKVDKEIENLFYFKTTEMEALDVQRNDALSKDKYKEGIRGFTKSDIDTVYNTTHIDNLEKTMYETFIDKVNTLPQHTIENEQFKEQLKSYLEQSYIIIPKKEDIKTIEDYEKQLEEKLTKKIIDKITSEYELKKKKN